MIHGRVLKPAAPGARLLSLPDVGAVAGLIAVVRDGSFAGVLAETEAAAENALSLLRKGATWSPGENPARCRKACRLAADGARRDDHRR
jgi:hypothetical protein